MFAFLLGTNYPTSTTYPGSPNGDSGVDAMISILAHETMETFNDPWGNTWYTKPGGTQTAGQEIGDLCAYKYGSMKSGTASNAASDPIPIQL